MKPRSVLLLALGLACLAPLHASDLVSPTSEVAARPILDLSAPATLSQAQASHAQVSITSAANGAGLDIAVVAGPASYPGVNFMPAADGFNFAGAGYVEARLTNTGTQVISATLRVDNPGGKGSATGVAYLRPGQSGAARAYFASAAKGANPVDPANVGRILVFIGKNEKADRAFRIDALTVGGSAGEQAAVNPDLVRAKPVRGLIFGGGAPFVAAKQLLPRGGAKVVPGTTAKDPIAVTFTGGANESILVRPAQGLWDLSDQLQVRIRLKNTGSTPLGLSAQLTSRGGSSESGVTAKPLPPGATGDVVVSFIPGAPFEIISDPVQEQLEPKKNWGVKDTPGSRFFSHQTSGLSIQAIDGSSPAAASFDIVSIVAELPPPVTPPSWLGQRPPVAGDWVKTFEDNFDGTALNTSVWNTYASNHWDKRVGFSKQNVILGDGVARLRIEKRAGFHNDDPEQRATDFATGWLDTYGKWTQRYGYYEVRVKLPVAPSMFPAFWLMPERGPANWPKYRRTDTKDGGMEFDVFEGQSMWGPYRTTFGAHWDAYMKHHKVAGTTAHYNLPDKDGFLTIGFLWTPGHVSVYSQGRKGGSWDTPRIGSVQSYLIFDLLPGGFEYDPLDPATLPADLVIDYIRVWQRKDLATAEDGPKSAPISQ